MGARRNNFLSHGLVKIRDFVWPASPAYIPTRCGLLVELVQEGVGSRSVLLLSLSTLTQTKDKAQALAM
jgi:hypothetical protein